MVSIVLLISRYSKKKIFKQFHNSDVRPITIDFNGVEIKSKKNINVLGVIFDQKMQWSDHIAYTVLKSNNALNAVRLLKKHFNTKELLQIVTSNFYSILYYNSEIWHLQSLRANLKQSLLSASAKALKTCLKYRTDDVSFIKIHEICNRATPEKYLLYKHALSLFKLMKDNNHSFEWVSLNFNIILTSRQTEFFSLKGNNKRVGLNAMSNRFYILNNRIPLNLLNQSIDTYKVHCKRIFLTM